MNDLPRTSTSHSLRASRNDRRFLTPGWVMHPRKAGYVRVFVSSASVEIADRLLTSSQQDELAKLLVQPQQSDLLGMADGGEIRQLTFEEKFAVLFLDAFQEGYVLVYSISYIGDDPPPRLMRSATRALRVLRIGSTLYALYRFGKWIFVGGHEAPMTGMPPIDKGSTPGSAASSVTSFAGSAMALIDATASAPLTTGAGGLDDIDCYNTGNVTGLVCAHTGAVSSQRYSAFTPCDGNHMVRGQPAATLTALGSATPGSFSVHIGRGTGMTVEDSLRRDLLEAALAELRACQRGDADMRTMVVPAPVVDVSEVRRRAGYGDSDVPAFAKLLGVPYDTVIAWECGDFDPDPVMTRVLLLLADYPEEVIREINAMRGYLQ